MLSLYLKFLSWLTNWTFSSLAIGLRSPFKCFSLPESTWLSSLGGILEIVTDVAIYFAVKIRALKSAQIFSGVCLVSRGVIFSTCDHDGFIFLLLDSAYFLLDDVDVSTTSAVNGERIVNGITSWIQWAGCLRILVHCPHRYKFMYLTK